MLSIYKTRRKREPIRVFPDGREVCDCDTNGGLRIYSSRTYRMDERQKGLCAICREWMTHPTFDHEAGRGAGKRDDRIVVGGKWKNAALCVPCQGLKGSKHYHWIEGKYTPVVKIREVA